MLYFIRIITIKFHKTVLESIRATIQARQRKKLFLQGRPVYPLATHYCQTWQHLPDYGAYHAALIADPALPGKWQPGEEVVYQLVFECELLDGSTPESQARRMLASPLLLSKYGSAQQQTSGTEPLLVAEDGSPVT